MAVTQRTPPWGAFFNSSQKKEGMKSPASSLDIIPGLSYYRVLMRTEKICSVSRLCSVLGYQCSFKKTEERNQANRD